MDQGLDRSAAGGHGPPLHVAPPRPPRVGVARGPPSAEPLRAARRRVISPHARPGGKFSAGQKLYAGWIAGAVLVMMFTGLLMWFMGLLPLISRTSAIFVHDTVAWAIFPS